MSAELIVNYTQIRRRLRAPSNAVVDLGIDLKRKLEIVREPEQPVPTPVDIIDLGIAEAVAIIRKVRPLNVRDIQRRVCAETDICMEQMCGSSRTGYLVRCRHIAMYLVRNVLRKSFPETARAFGGRDHTTVLSACRKMERLLPCDQDLACVVAYLEANLVAIRDGASA